MDINELNFFDFFNEVLIESNLNLIAVFIILLIIIGTIIIGIGIFNHRSSSISRLGKVYLGSFIVITAAFLSTYLGYMPWQ